MGYTLWQIWSGMNRCVSYIKDTSTPLCWCRPCGRDFWGWKRRGISLVEGCLLWPVASSASPSASSSAPLHSWWPALLPLRWPPSWHLQLRQDPSPLEMCPFTVLFQTEAWVAHPMQRAPLCFRPVWAPPSPSDSASPPGLGPLTEKAPSAGKNNRSLEWLNEQLVPALV